MAGLSKGAANQHSAATALTPIAELKELSIDKVPPKTESPLELEISEPGIVDGSIRVGARPTTKADFLVSARKFKPGHEAEMAKFFHDIRVDEARKMGRPERECKSPPPPFPPPPGAMALIQIPFSFVNSCNAYTSLGLRTPGTRLDST